MIARTLVLHLLKTIYVAFSITGLICSAQAKQPNVVFILVDDLGYMDIGANNPKTFYETPNVDALAALFTYTVQEDKSVTRPLGEFPVKE